MNGPEHYREAERLIALANLHHEISQSGDIGSLLALAQVHATLALAAATALADTDPNGSGMPVPDFEIWSEAAGVKTVASAGPTCSQCPTPVQPGTPYCSTACRNLDDRHDDGEVAE